MWSDSRLMDRRGYADAHELLRGVDRRRRSGVTEWGLLVDDVVLVFAEAGNDFVDLAVTCGSTARPWPLMMSGVRASCHEDGSDLVDDGVS